MELFNGGNIPLKDIPVLAEKEFREEVLLRCREDARLMNFFGCAEDGGGVDTQIRAQGAAVGGQVIEHHLAGACGDGDGFDEAGAGQLLADGIALSAGQVQPLIA